MNRITVIALNTFRETLRDKILYNLVFFGLLLIGSAILLSTLTIGEQAKIIQDIGLASINVFGVIIAIPVPRHMFLLGKYSGLALTLLVNVGIMAAGFFLTVLVSKAGLDLALLKAVGLIFMELLVITAVAVMFSTFTTPTLSATFTLAIYVIGHLTDDLKVLGAKLGESLTKAILDGLYYSLPNLEYFNVKGQAVHGLPIEPSYLVSAAAYGVAYTTILLILACMIFQRRDFK